MKPITDGRDYLRQMILERPFSYRGAYYEPDEGFCFMYEAPDGEPSELWLIGHDTETAALVYRTIDIVVKAIQEDINGLYALIQAFDRERHATPQSDIQSAGEPRNP